MLYHPKSSAEFLTRMMCMHPHHHSLFTSFQRIKNKHKIKNPNFYLSSSSTCLIVTPPRATIASPTPSIGSRLTPLALSLRSPSPTPPQSPSSFRHWEVLTVLASSWSQNRFVGLLCRPIVRRRHCCRHGRWPITLWCFQQLIHLWFWFWSSICNSI